MNKVFWNGKNGTLHQLHLMTHMVEQEVGMFLGKASGGHNSTSSELHPLVLLLMELKYDNQHEMMLCPC